MNVAVKATNASNKTGYKSFELGSFKFRRDEYFVYIEWKSKKGPMTHYISADAFLRASATDVRGDETLARRLADSLAVMM